MAKFRKKPVVIEAVQYLDGKESAKETIRFMATTDSRDPGVVIGDVDDEGPFLAIKTREGTMKARHGDWIIRGIQGELYPCKPDIFAATYEAVE